MPAVAVLEAAAAAGDKKQRSEYLLGFLLPFPRHGTVLTARETACAVAALDLSTSSCRDMPNSSYAASPLAAQRYVLQYFASKNVK